MTASRRATVTVHSDGNGGRVLSVNLTVMQMLLGVLVSFIAVYAGVSQGVERIGTGHIRSWWQGEGCTATQILIDDSIADHQRDTELELQRDIARLERQINEIKTITEQNQAMTNRIIDKLIGQ